MKHTEHELDIMAERKAFVEILRSTPESQHTTGVLWRDGKRQYCAIGKYVVVTKGRRCDEDNAFEYAKTRLGPITDQVVQWNDECRLTFAEIADRIEESLEH